MSSIKSHSAGPRPPPLSPETPSESTVRIHVQAAAEPRLPAAQACAPPRMPIAARAGPGRLSLLLGLLPLVQGDAASAVEMLAGCGVQKVIVGYHVGAGDQLALVNGALEGARRDGTPVVVCADDYVEGWAMTSEERAAEMGDLDHAGVVTMLEDTVVNNARQRGNTPIKTFRRLLGDPGVTPVYLSSEPGSRWGAAHCLAAGERVVAGMEIGRAAFEMVGHDRYRVPWLGDDTVALSAGPKPHPLNHAASAPRYGVFQWVGPETPAALLTSTNAIPPDEIASFRRHWTQQGFAVLEFPLFDGVEAIVVTPPADPQAIERFVREVEGARLSMPPAEGSATGAAAMATLGALGAGGALLFWKCAGRAEQDVTEERAPLRKERKPLKPRTERETKPRTASGSDSDGESKTKAEKAQQEAARTQALASTPLDPLDRGDILHEVQSRLDAAPSEQHVRLLLADLGKEYGQHMAAADSAGGMARAAALLSAVLNRTSDNPARRERWLGWLGVELDTAVRALQAASQAATEGTVPARQLAAALTMLQSAQAAPASPASAQLASPGLAPSPADRKETSAAMPVPMTGTVPGDIPAIYRFAKEGEYAFGRGGKADVYVPGWRHPEHLHITRDFVVLGTRHGGHSELARNGEFHVARLRQALENLPAGAYHDHVRRILVEMARQAGLQTSRIADQGDPL